MAYPQIYLYYFLVTYRFISRRSLILLEGHHLEDKGYFTTLLPSVFHIKFSFITWRSTDIKYLKTSIIELIRLGGIWRDKKIQSNIVKYCNTLTQFKKLER